MLDAGTTDSGRPYFVMELVKGVPITQYCDEHHLTPRERLELFVPVCYAVQHAHQKGIIHRDIKPSNVLVAKYDDRPVPKVIDFGVAKAIEQRLTEKTVFTQFGQVIGTVEYMSPEQANLNQLDIDTRSDIYSLGVLLYELLTGETPFDRQRLRSAAFDELLRIIREEEPPKPSLRLSTSESLPSIAANRQIDPKKLSTAVRGELDWIVMKALEKDRTRRYETATGFANDVERYLNDEPVVACPPSAAYRLRKFLRRNRVPITTILGLVAAITIVATLGVMAHRRGLRETEFRRLAEIAEREKAEAELDARVEEGLRLGSGLYPDFAAAVDCFSGVLKARPEESSLYLFRGSAYYQWGRPNEAIADLERALALSPEDNFAAHHLIAIAAHDLGDQEKAAQHRHLAEQQEPESVEALVAQALAIQFEERALELMNQAIEKRPFDPLLYYRRGQIATDLAIDLANPTYYQAAVRDLEMALAGRPTDDSIRGALCLVLLWGSLLADDPPASKERSRVLAEEWLERAPGHSYATATLIGYYWSVGQPAKAVAVLSEEQQAGPLSHYVLSTLGDAYDRLGNHDKSLDMFERALADGEHPWTYAQRARAHAKLGHHELARRDIEEALNRSSPRMVKVTFTCLQETYDAMDDHEAVVRTANERLQQVPGDAEAHVWRARAYARLGQSKRALADHDQAIQLAPTSCGAFLSRGDTYREIGNSKSALADYDRAIQLGSTAFWAFHARGDHNREIGNLESALADYDRAIQLDSTSPWTFFHRGNCQRKLGNPNAAIADYNEAFRLGLNDPRVLDGVAWYLATSPEFRMQDPGRAVELAQKAVELSPKEAAFWNTLGAAQYRAGQWKAAIASRQKSMELDSGWNSFPQFHVAMAYWQLGQKDEARRWYDRSVELMEEHDPDNEDLRRFRAEAARLLGVLDTLPEEKGETEAPTNEESGSEGEESRSVESTPSQP